MQLLTIRRGLAVVVTGLVVFAGGLAICMAKTDFMVHFLLGESRTVWGHDGIRRLAFGGLLFPSGRLAPRFTVRQGRCGRRFDGCSFHGSPASRKVFRC